MKNMAPYRANMSRMTSTVPADRDAERNSLRGSSGCRARDSRMTNSSPSSAVPLDRAAVVVLRQLAEAGPSALRRAGGPAGGGGAACHPAGAAAAARRLRGPRAGPGRPPRGDRKSGVEGKRVDLGGRRIIKKKKRKHDT